MPSTHTPGPWHVGNDDHDGLWWTVYAEDIAEAADTLVAQCEYGFWGRPEIDTAMQNARLIAAAPALLAAAEAALHDRPSAHTDEVYAQLRAAIALARGEDA